MNSNIYLGTIEEEEGSYIDARDATESETSKTISVNSSPVSKSTASSAYNNDGLGEISKNFQDETAENYNINPKANSDLWEAVERNDINRIKELLDKNRYGAMVAQPNAKGLNEWTALHLASSYGFLEACEVLIYYGNNTNIDALTTMNRTPLHLAALHGHLQVVQLLVQKGADINAKDNDYSTPTHYAAMHGDIEIVT